MPHLQRSMPHRFRSPRRPLPPDLLRIEFVGSLRGYFGPTCERILQGEVRNTDGNGVFDLVPGARLLAIIGTAGDRADAVPRGIGRQAGAETAFVWVRGTVHYLRGRSGEAINELFVAGIAEGRDGAAGGMHWWRRRDQVTRS